MSAGLKRWKPYPAYKESGVEWLGQVPEGWEVKRLKFGVDNINQKCLEEAPLTPFVALEHIEPWTGKLMVDESSQSDGQPSCYQSDDVLFCKLRPYLAKVHLAKVNGICTSELLVLRAQHGIFPKYLHRFLLSRDTIDCITASTYGAKMPRANWEFIGNLLLPIPPLPEQRAIAAFLDQQCAQIDSLIEKKQRMLDLLDEKRRAVITQAVTRGLDPTVPMKDSGVEWLGKVPEGWKVGRVAFGYDIVLGKMLQPSPNSEKDIAVPYYRAMNVQWESIDSDLKVMWATPEEIKTFSVRQGDMLVCEGGEVGRAAIINLPVDEPTIIQNALHRVRSFKDCNICYLLRVLEHVASADWFSVLCNKSTIAHFTGEKFKALKCPLPPLPEQQAIADYLDAQCAAMDSQRKNLEKSIELLREYRASLITHAVTGKIDVRDVAPLQ